MFSLKFDCSGLDKLSITSEGGGLPLPPSYTKNKEEECATPQAVTLKDIAN